MAISATERKAMAAGTTLVGTYKRETYECEVIEGEGGGLRYRLADGRDFKSPSAAASAITGSAQNGWRFFTFRDAAEQAEPTEQAEATEQQPDAEAKPRGPARPTCPACGKSFVGDKQLQHHEANRERLCKPAAV